MAKSKKKVEKEYTVTVDKDTSKLVVAAQKVAIARKDFQTLKAKLEAAKDKLDDAIAYFDEEVDIVKHNKDDDVFYGDDSEWISDSYCDQDDW